MMLQLTSHIMIPVPLGIGDVVAQKISCQGVFQVAKVA